MLFEQKLSVHRRRINSKESTTSRSKGIVLLPSISLYKTEPAYLSSFAEQAKHVNRGYRFGQSQGRLTFKVQPGPGPNVYEPAQADHYLKSSTKGAAVMGLSPCKRLTDEIVSDALKKSVPGYCFVKHY